MEPHFHTMEENVHVIGDHGLARARRPRPRSTSRKCSNVRTDPHVPVANVRTDPHVPVVRTCMFRRVTNPSSASKTRPLEDGHVAQRLSVTQSPTATHRTGTQRGEQAASRQSAAGRPLDSDLSGRTAGSPTGRSVGLSGVSAAHRPTLKWLPSPTQTMRVTNSGNIGHSR